MFTDALIYYCLSLHETLYRWIENCGHCPHLEQPAEAAAAIAGFVTGKPVSKVCVAA
jgi:pimeloyl-ACP methyl ester carboxylesterase